MNKRGYSRSRGNSGRAARPMDWVCGQLDVALGPNASACGWLADPIFILDTFTDPTLMATRAFMEIRTETSTSIGTFAAIGLIAWDGVTSGNPPVCPGPLSDCDFDWAARWVAAIPRNTPAGSVVSPNIFDNTHLSRARRRLPSQTGLLVSFETDGIQAGFAIDLRCLIKE